MSKELKPCPFCGEQPELEIGEIDLNGSATEYSFQYFCDNCQIFKGEFRSISATRHDWNTRTPSATQEHLRLKELECKELAKDKKELLETLNGIHNEAVDYQNRSGKPVTWCLKIGKLLERLG